MAVFFLLSSDVGNVLYPELLNQHVVSHRARPISVLGGGGDGAIPILGSKKTSPISIYWPIFFVYFYGLVTL